MKGSYNFFIYNQRYHLSEMADVVALRVTAISHTKRKISHAKFCFHLWKAEQVSKNVLCETKYIMENTTEV